MRASFLRLGAKVMILASGSGTDRQSIFYQQAQASAELQTAEKHRQCWAVTSIFPDFFDFLLFSWDKIVIDRV